jgi:hypothetical protein
VVRFLSDTAHEDVPATVLTSYHVEVRFWGQAMTPSQQALFTNAAQRIEGFVTGDVEDALAQGIDLNQACGVSGQPTMNETIDDVIIYASIQPIDGAGQILAQSGPCLIRDDPQAILPPFPAVGIMEFDSADLATLSAGGSLQDVITHEMMHVMGFGVIWDLSPLDLLDNAGTADPEFNGTTARTACVALGGTSTCAAAVPVEGTPAPAGTADSHWRESTFDAEIMTGYIDGNNPISTMTIGSFADMGYTVNSLDNDAYSLSSVRASERSSSVLQTYSWDRVLQPRWLLNPVTGRTRPIQVK